MVTNLGNGLAINNMESFMHYCPFVRRIHQSQVDLILSEFPSQVPKEFPW